MTAALHLVKDVVQTDAETQVVGPHTQAHIAVVQNPGPFRDRAVRKFVRQTVSKESLSFVSADLQLPVTRLSLGLSEPQPAAPGLDDPTPEQLLGSGARPSTRHAAPSSPATFDFASLGDERLVAGRARAFDLIGETGTRAVEAATGLESVGRRFKRSLATSADTLYEHRWCTPSVSGPRRLTHVRGPNGALIVPGGDQG